MSAWPEELRPRERLLARGPAALTDAELLAIFLRVGVRGCSAVDLAREVLHRFGGLRGLYAAPVSELLALRGFGPAKAAQLAAALELGRRYQQAVRAARPVVSDAEAAYALLAPHYAGRRTEAVTLLLLDAGNALLELVDVAEGTVDGAACYPREVVRAVVRADATAVVLAHNHPSGRARPSEADRHLTRRIAAALRAIDVRLLDHLVCGEGRYYSFADHGEASLR
ncbi:MAG: DNA repair protein RadC [Nitrospirae bacterium]|nr:MAG: DNA repair protein RadC [Nitrospirota bacterium]